MCWYQDLKKSKMTNIAVGLCFLSFKANTNLVEKIGIKLHFPLEGLCSGLVIIIVYLVDYYLGCLSCRA